MQEVNRLYDSPIQSTSKLPKSTSKTTTILPGLISTLKPIKRNSIQFIEESLLLRRFCYKNKNQYKSNGWWKKLIQVDRNLERVSSELLGFLSEFGLGIGTEEGNRIGSEELLAGLLRLPRSILVLENFVSVLLKAAGIFEQLIHLRAFMSFSVVLVALISRLHTLATVLLEEFIRTKFVLLKLMDTNPLLSKYQTALKKLPSSLQDQLTPSLSFSLPSPLQVSLTKSTTPSGTTTPTSIDLFNLLSGGGEEELGKAIPRSMLKPKNVSTEIDGSSLLSSIAQLNKDIEDMEEKNKNKRKQKGIELTSITDRELEVAEVEKISEEQEKLSSYKRGLKAIKKKSRTVEERDDTLEGEEVVKRKKVKIPKKVGKSSKLVKEDLDEIDDIFG